VPDLYTAKIPEPAPRYELGNVSAIVTFGSNSCPYTVLSGEVVNNIGHWGNALLEYQEMGAFQPCTVSFESEFVASYNALSMWVKYERAPGEGISVSVTVLDDEDEVVWSDTKSVTEPHNEWHQLKWTIPGVAGAKFRVNATCIGSDEKAIVIDTIEVTGFGAEGCGTAAGGSGYFELAIIANPSGQIYTGTPVTFTLVATGDTPDGYSWNFGDGTAFLGEQVRVHEYSEEGKYTIRATASSETGLASAVLEIDVKDGVYEGRTIKWFYDEPLQPDFNLFGFIPRRLPGGGIYLDTPKYRRAHASYYWDNYPQYSNSYYPYFELKFPPGEMQSVSYDAIPYSHTIGFYRGDTLLYVTGWRYSDERLTFNYNNEVDRIRFTVLYPASMRTQYSPYGVITISKIALNITSIQPTLREVEYGEDYAARSAILTGDAYGTYGVNKEVGPTPENNNSPQAEAGMSFDLPSGVNISALHFRSRALGYLGAGGLLYFNGARPEGNTSIINRAICGQYDECEWYYPPLRDYGESGGTENVSVISSGNMGNSAIARITWVKAMWWKFV
jgi:PKD repeat protein